jgi:hypothetical protein
MVEFSVLATTSLICSLSIVRKTFPSLSIVIKTTSLSGATFAATELGVVTAMASAGLNFVVKIKNDNRRNATSHIAVMSMLVLLRGNLALPIVNNLLGSQIKIQNIVQYVIVGINYL